MGHALHHLVQLRRIQMELCNGWPWQPEGISGQWRLEHSALQHSGAAVRGSFLPFARHRVARMAQSATGDRRLSR